VRNPKPETRNPKQIQNPKEEMFKTARLSRFEPLDFEFRIGVPMTGSTDKMHPHQIPTPLRFAARFAPLPALRAIFPSC
jgi:hypothetical protein